MHVGYGVDGEMNVNIGSSNINLLERIDTQDTILLVMFYIMAVKVY